MRSRACFNWPSWAWEAISKLEWSRVGKRTYTTGAATHFSVIKVHGPKRLWTSGACIQTARSSCNYIVHVINLVWLSIRRRSPSRHFDDTSPWWPGSMVWNAGAVRFMLSWYFLLNVIADELFSGVLECALLSQLKVNQSFICSKRCQNAGRPGCSLLKSALNYS